MPHAAEIEPGNIVVVAGETWKVLDVRRPSSGARDGRVRATLRNLRTGATDGRRFRATDHVRLAAVEERDLQYLYAEGGLHHFMDVRSFEQAAVDADLLGDALRFVRLSDTVRMQVLDGRPVGVVLPGTVDLTVTETLPAADDESGDEDAGADVFKDATLETGLTIRVPLFVEMDERVRVDTRTGRFVERVP